MTRQTSTPGTIVAPMANLKFLVGLGCLTAASIVLLPAISRAAVIDGQIVCFNDRPCIEAASTQGDAIRLFWRNNLSYDFYKIRWSRPGKDPTDAQLDGGQSGSINLGNVVPNTAYTFQLQGCNGQVIGGPICSEWEVQEIVTGEGIPQPTPEQPTGAEPFATPAPEAASTPEASPAPATVSPDAAPLNTPPLEPASVTPAPPGNSAPEAAPAPDAPAYVVPVVQ